MFESNIAMYFWSSGMVNEGKAVHKVFLFIYFQVEILPKRLKEREQVKVGGQLQIKVFVLVTAG